MAISIGMVPRRLLLLRSSSTTLFPPSQIVAAGDEVYQSHSLALVSQSVELFHS
eukprot:CAMPEP_0198121768 /NCGR_PEP_ID=MMETSP1442-20131203/33041_1 /TAXON_ID= /ORGANISM="Craspedostauros australis, Strain CCMP3328" /LENGTH=53 /DNA_ID=CAMNT_0043780641 /DNA_START=32 /DNA_END=189 /DNA_ORIENTATION=-